MDDLVAGGILNSIKSRFVTGEPWASCGSFHLYVHDFQSKSYQYDSKAFSAFAAVPYKPEPYSPHVYNMAIRAYERSIEGGRSSRYPKGAARPEALQFPSMEIKSTCRGAPFGPADIAAPAVDAVRTRAR